MYKPMCVIFSKFVFESKEQVEAVKQCHIDNVISVNQVH